MMRKLLFGMMALCCLNLVMVKPAIAEPSTVTLTEYFDYECPHCRKMEPVVQQLRENYPNLKVEQRVTPLLNDNSRFVASFALASQSTNSGQAVHELLMSSSIAPTVETVVSLVTRLQLNPLELKRIMNTDAVQQTLTQNIQSAQHYAVNGNIYLPIWVFSDADEKGQTITLSGEQPYPLLAAVVQQLSEHNVQQRQ